jgi:hypothetical protein
MSHQDQNADATRATVSESSTLAISETKLVAIELDV